MSIADLDERMRDALEMAREALSAGDHPYGAVIVTQNGAIAERNRVVSNSDPTAHSEVMAIRRASAEWGLESTHGAALITTFEPCPMCCGAIMEAGIDQLVIAVRRALGEAPLGDYSVERLLSMTGATARITVSQGVLGESVGEFYALAADGVIP
jgi:tRNA(adenine34) deaminase